jgi:hypothetical protein
VLSDVVAPVATPAVSSAKPEDDSAAVAVTTVTVASSLSAFVVWPTAIACAVERLTVSLAAPIGAVVAPAFVLEAAVAEVATAVTNDNVLSSWVVTPADTAAVAFRDEVLDAVLLLATCCVVDSDTDADSCAEPTVAADADSDVLSDADAAADIASVAFSDELPLSWLRAAIASVAESAVVADSADVAATISAACSVAWDDAVAAAATAWLVAAVAIADSDALAETDWLVVSDTVSDSAADDVVMPAATPLALDVLDADERAATATAFVSVTTADRVALAAAFPTATSDAVSLAVAWAVIFTELLSVDVAEQLPLAAMLAVVTSTELADSVAVATTGAASSATNETRTRLAILRPYSGRRVQQRLSGESYVCSINRNKIPWFLSYWLSDNIPHSSPVIIDISLSISYV